MQEIYLDDDDYVCCDLPNYVKNTNKHYNHHHHRRHHHHYHHDMMVSIIIIIIVIIITECYSIILQTKRSSKVVLGIVDSVNYVMLNNLQVGDPPAVITIDKMRLVVDKQTADKMSDSLICTDMGYINVSWLASNSPCLERKVG